MSAQSCTTRLFPTVIEVDLSRICAFSLTGQGNNILLKLKSFFPQINCFTKKRYEAPGLKSFTEFKPFFKQIFKTYDAVIAICACGIVVRSLAPLINDKFSDPAVIVIDPRGHYVIPILSGHIGGANALAIKLAEALRAQAVITTASDNEGIVSVDLFAKRNGCRFDRGEALALTSLLLDHKKIAVIGFDEPLSPECVILAKKDFREEDYDGLIVRGDFETKLPVAHLYPKRYVLGLGMRKNLSENTIRESILKFLSEMGISPGEVDAVATIPIKAADKNLKKVAEELGYKIIVVEPEDIKAVEDRFKTSDFVRETVGIGAVCEPCGYLGSKYGRKVTGKVKRNGVTISLWEKST